MIVLRIRSRNAPICRALLFTGAFLLFTLSAFSQYNFSENCLEAYRDIFSLRFTEAAAKLNEEQKSDPGNLVPVLFSNYIDFLTVFIDEESSSLEKFRTNRSDRILKLESGNKDSPWYNFCLSQVYLQSAFARVKFGEYTAAAFDLRKAYLLIGANQARFPAFLPDKTGIGVIHTVAGLVPDGYKWIRNLLGFDGTIEQGIKEISLMAGYDGDDRVIRLFRPEACFYLGFLTANLQKNKKNALQVLDQLDQQTRTEKDVPGPLLIFVRAAILMKNGQNGKALQVLQSRERWSGTFPFYYLDYMEGVARLNSLDLSASVLFRNFLEYFHGQNYIRSAYQKLAWISILKGDTNGYHHFINLAANRGSSKTDEDRQAIHEAKSGQVPGVILLRARLLCDGGYYDRALKEILDNPVGNVVKTKRDLIEYSYRLGRIYHELGNEYRATGFYKQTIRRGKSEPYYFAASAALQLGLLYENTGNYKGADSAYRVCLLTDTPEYRNSIAQKAKAGIARVKNHLP